MGSIFSDKKAVIATMHGKQQVIKPPILLKTGMLSAAINDFNTDIYGTFNGQTPRKGTPLEVCRKKCLDAIKQSGLTCGIASEGSFFPHPEIPLLHVNEEWMVFIDIENGWEIHERFVTTETNINGKQINNESDLLTFAENALFPSHGLIVRKSLEDFTDELKGIRDLRDLLNHFNYCQSLYGSAYVETDMRAFQNPSRMKAIGKLADKLADKMNSLCPQCSSPGFGVKEFISGLPCGQCGTPTRSILAHRYECQYCQFSATVEFPNNIEVEDPMYCDVCNP